VLWSAGDRLADIDRIQLEVAITPGQLYAGAADRATILAYMAGKGFDLVQTEVQSSGQEENLTFERAGIRATADNTSTVTLVAETNMVHDLYRFADAFTAHGEVRHEADCLVLITDPRQWAYTVVIPVGAPAQDDETGRFRVDLAVKVDSGAVQVGILDRKENDFTSSAVVGNSDAWQAVTLTTSPLNRAGPLVIRNAYHDGTSSATCRMVAVTQIPGPPTEEIQDSGASLEETATQAERLRAAALGLIAAPASVLTGTVAATMRDAVLQLRRPLARGGVALIDATATAIGAVFARLTTDRLHKLAREFSRLRPLAPFPGWRYDSFLESDELLTFMRYGIWLALSERPDAEPVVLPWHGGTSLAVHFGNDLSLAIFVHGCFEPNEFAFVSSVVRPGMTVIDAGANEGVYTAFFAGRVGREGRVVAIEPSPRELVRLENNLRLNGADRVEVVRAALTEQKGEVPLVLAEDHHAGQNTLGDIIYPGVSQAGRVIVPATTLDALVTTHRLDQLDIVKLDVEGAEIRALSGGASLLERCKPLLLLEASDASLRRQGGSVRKLLDVLKETGYVPFCFDAATGLPTLLQDDAAVSDNLIAVHPDRRFGL
jgi:FkbM family methyltransferase